MTKDTGIAYVLLILFGGFGVHHFYLENVGLGISYFFINLVCWILAPFTIGISLLPIAVLLIVDLFTLQTKVKHFNKQKATL